MVDVRVAAPGSEPHHALWRAAGSHQWYFAADADGDPAVVGSRRNGEPQALFPDPTPCRIRADPTRGKPAPAIAAAGHLGRGTFQRNRKRPKTIH